jgi:mRNA interferase RelE/StbE
MDKRFEIEFLPKAKKDLNKLDGSVKKLLNVALLKLEFRADEIGEQLSNKEYAKLQGCRRIKLKKHGIRIVYRIIKRKLEIVQIIAIGKRTDNEIYKEAHKRLKSLLEDGDSPPPR